MLTYVVLSITAYLVLEILRAAHSADATGYLLVSGLIPLPLYLVGKSAEAAAYPIDVCLLAYLVAHSRSALQYVLEHRVLSAGVSALFGFSILATFSGIFNFITFDSGALKFYAYTVVRFWEYAFLATFLIASRPDKTQVRRICILVISGILFYEILHGLQVSGILPLSGEEYFGPRAAEYDAGEVRASPFSDRTAWFLTSYRGVIGGTASINAWFSLMVFEAFRGKIKAVALATAILSVFSVLAVSSRSDIAGLAVAAVVFAFCAPSGRWKVYAASGVAIIGLYAAYLAIVPQADQATAMSRMSELWNPELRAVGDYADRSADRASLASYLQEHPRELLIGTGPGNFHWYEARRITYNFFGHNSYLHWTGELGIGGLILLLSWCFSVCMYAATRRKSQSHIASLAAGTCVAIVTGRMVTAWGSESLFGTQGMGGYSLYLVGIVYLLVSIISDASLPRLSLPRTTKVLRNMSV